MLVEMLFIVISCDYAACYSYYLFYLFFHRNEAVNR